MTTSPGWHCPVCGHYPQVRGCEPGKCSLPASERVLALDCIACKAKAGEKCKGNAPCDARVAETAFAKGIRATASAIADQHAAPAVEAPTINSRPTVGEPTWFETFLATRAGQPTQRPDESATDFIARLRASQPPVRCIIVEPADGEAVRLCQSDAAVIQGAVLLTPPSKSNCEACRARVDIDSENSAPEPVLFEAPPTWFDRFMAARAGQPMQRPDESDADFIARLKAANPEPPHPSPWRWTQDEDLTARLVDANGVVLIETKSFNGARLRALTERSPRFESLLRALEWGDTGVESSTDDLWRCCPVCAGVNPGYLGKDAPKRLARGHVESCELAALLAHLDSAKGGT